MSINRKIDRELVFPNHKSELQTFPMGSLSLAEIYVVQSLEGLDQFSWRKIRTDF